MSSSASAENSTLKASSSDIWEILKITWKKSAVVTRYGSNQSAGYKKAIAGQKSGELTVEGKFDTALASPLLEGTSVTVQNYFDGTHFWNIPCVVQDFEVEEDIDDGTPISFKATLFTNGAWTEPTFP